MDDKNIKDLIDASKEETNGLLEEVRASEKEEHENLIELDSLFRQYVQDQDLLDFLYARREVLMLTGIVKMTYIGKIVTYGTKSEVYELMELPPGISVENVPKEFIKDNHAFMRVEDVMNDGPVAYFLFVKESSLLEEKSVELIQENVYNQINQIVNPPPKDNRILG